MTEEIEAALAQLREALDRMFAKLDSGFDRIIGKIDAIQKDVTWIKEHSYGRRTID
jgi:hypothetical protein